MELLEQIIGFVATPHAVAAFSVFVNVVLWRAFREESKSKDELYEQYVGKLVEIVGDYHEFAHTLDRYVEAQSSKVEARGDIDEDRAGA